MKKILYLIFAFIFAFLGCNNKDIKVIQKPYDFEALRDTLNIDSSCIFVEECSPYYTDDNPYQRIPEERIKTMFYCIVQAEGIEEDGYDTLYWGNHGPDTILYVVLRNNDFQRYARTVNNDRIKETINHIINNREKY